MTADCHEGIPFERYLAMPGESATGLKDLLVSPLLYAWRQEHGRPDKDSFRVGRACHTAILEPHRFRDEYVVWEGGRRYGREWDAFRVEHQAQTILTQAQFEVALQVSKATRIHPVAAALLEEPAKAELSITWQHERTGIACKSRLDRLCSSLVDVKTCRDPSPHMFGGQAARLGYHVQMAFYSAALSALGLSVPIKLIAVQNTEPFDVVVYGVPDEVIIIGEQMFEQALDRLVQCRAMATWPGLSDVEIPLRLPTWAVPHFDDELTVGGEPLFAEVG